MTDHEKRPAHLAGGLDAIPAVMARVRQKTAMIQDAKRYLAVPKWCNFCGCWWDLWVSAGCPVCHRSGDRNQLAILHCELMTAGEARDLRVPPEDMRP